MLSSSNNLFLKGLRFIPENRRPEYYALLGGTQQSAVSAQSSAFALVLKSEPHYSTQSNLALDLKITRFVFEHGNENKHAFSSEAKKQLDAQVVQLRTFNENLTNEHDKGQLALCVREGTILGERLSQPHDALSINQALTSYEKQCQSLDKSFFERSYQALFNSLDKTFSEGFRNQATIAELKKKIKNCSSSDEKESLSRDLMRIDAIENIRVQQINKACSTISHGFTLVAMIASFSDDPVVRNQANKVASIANAACTIITNIACFSTIAAASGPLAPVVAIIGAISTIFQLFNTGPSELEIVSGQIVKLSEQLDKFRVEMNENFIRIEKQISEGFNALAAHIDHRFDRIEQQLKYLHNTLIEIDQLALKRFISLHENLRTLHNETQWIRSGIDQIRREMNIRFRDAYERDFIAMSNAASFFHQHTPFSETQLPAKTISKYYSQFITWITSACYSSTLTGNGTLLHEAVQDTQVLQNLECNIGPLIQYFYAQRGQQTAPNLPNPTAYLEGVRAFAQFIRNNPEVVLYKILDPGDLTRIANIGFNIDHTVLEIRTSSDFFSTLIKQYQERVKVILGDIKHVVSETSGGAVENQVYAHYQVTILDDLFKVCNDFSLNHVHSFVRIIERFRSWHSEAAYPAGVTTWHLAERSGTQPGNMTRWKNSCLDDALGQIGYYLQLIARSWPNGDNYRQVNELISHWNKLAQNISDLRHHAYQSEMASKRIELRLSQIYVSSTEKCARQFAEINQKAKQAKRVEDIEQIQLSIVHLITSLRDFESDCISAKNDLDQVIKSHTNPASDLANTLMQDSGLSHGDKNRDLEKIHPQIHSTRGFLGKRTLTNGAVHIRGQWNNFGSIDTFIDAWNSTIDCIDDAKHHCLQSLSHATSLRISLEHHAADIHRYIERLQNLLLKIERHIPMAKATITLKRDGFEPRNRFEEYVSCYLSDHERNQANARIREASSNQVEFKIHLNEMNNASLILRAFIQFAFPHELEYDTELHMLSQVLCDKRSFEKLLASYSGSDRDSFIYFVMQNALLEETLPQLDRRLRDLTTRSKELDTLACRSNLPRPSACPASSEAIGIINDLMTLYFPQAMPLYSQQRLDQMLQITARQGNQAAIQDLLQRGANPHTQENLSSEMMPEEPQKYREENRSALAWLVIASRRPGLVSFFLRVTGADPSIQNKWGWTAVHNAAYMGVWAEDAVDIMNTLLSDPRSRLSFFKRTVGGNETPRDIAQRALKDANSSEEKTRCNHVITLLEEAYEEERKNPSMGLHA